MADNFNPQSTQKPTEILAAEIIKFTEDIECLHTTLPLTMGLVGILQKDTGDKFTKFIDEYATDQTEKEKGIITYTLNIEDVKTSDNLKRQHRNFHNAYRLIPRHFVISLVSQYDSFLGKIIRFIYSAKPEKLNSSEKSLRYTDLMSFDSIQSAMEYLIEKEIESVIRKSHSEQFEWLTTKLKNPFNKNLKSWPTFIELTERRNLFVHCDGKVSSQYIKVCTENKCKINSSIKAGDELNVPNTYFEEAYRCIYEIGVKLAQVIWRRLYRNELESADENINNITYGLIDRGEYDLAIQLLDFFTEKHIKHASENNRLMLTINKAQAYKWLKNEKKCCEILNLEDWTASEDKFKIGVTVLRNDFNSAYDYMKRLKHNPEFHRAFYKDWPIFKKLRREEKFKDVYKECYDEDFRIEKSTEEKDDKNLTKR